MLKIAKISTVSPEIEIEVKNLSAPLVSLRLRLTFLIKSIPEGKHNDLVKASYAHTVQMIDEELAFIELKLYA